MNITGGQTTGSQCFMGSYPSGKIRLNRPRAGAAPASHIEVAYAQATTWRRLAFDIRAEFHCYQFLEFRQASESVEEELAQLPVDRYDASVNRRDGVRLQVPRCFNFRRRFDYALTLPS